jgi:hypothetical protein
MSYTTTRALGADDVHTVTFLFQRWSAKSGWSRGETFDSFAEAEQAQKEYYAGNEGTALAMTPSRILEVTATILYKCVNQ